MYKKIAEIQNEEDYRDMQEELIDRFGDIPKVTQNLLYIARIKAKAHQTGIEQIIQKPNGIRFFLHESRVVDGQKAAKMLKSYKEKLRYMPSEKPYFIYLIDQNQKKMPRTTRYTPGVATVQKVKVNTTQELFDMIEKVTTTTRPSASASAPSPPTTPACSTSSSTRCWQAARSTR